MNYIRHLNAFFTFVRKDQKLASSHVSLYLALFQYWNFNRFQNPFPVYRDDLMGLSKIGSKNTYHKCIKQLHEVGYIIYHPQASKFLPVKISMIRLDIKPEDNKTFRQLDLFQSAAAGNDSSCPKIDTHQPNSQCPINDTDSVPHLTGTSTDFDTVPVPKMGHPIKQNSKNNKCVLNTPTKNLDKKENVGEQNNHLARVPKMGHGNAMARVTRAITSKSEEPTLQEVEEFFQQNNYPAEEAKKFYLYNKGRGWMLTDKLPIKDWQSLAHKWMINVKQPRKKPVAAEQQRNINYLYERFKEGEKIFKYILPEHFDQLQLQLTEEILSHARKERIDQITGSNQYSLNQLHQAYETGNDQNELVQKDYPNLIALAKRLAVIKHFQQQV